MLLATVLSMYSVSAAVFVARHPDGPSQQCRDDAGPPWADDAGLPYFMKPSGQPNHPINPDGSKLTTAAECPGPLAASCAAKGPLAAHLDGPVDCGGRGWFCRITEEENHRMPGSRPGQFPDSNFVHCNNSESDSRADTDGHCHGSDVDNTYGWWIRDHWHRNYAGRLKCCCDWQATIGIVNRCDYRKYVSPDDVDNCRDANVEHNVDWYPGCTAGAAVIEPPDDQCWEVEHFGPGDEENGWPDLNMPSPSPSPPPPPPQPEPEEPEEPEEPDSPWEEDSDDEEEEEEEEEEDYDDLPYVILSTFGSCPDGYTAVEGRSACNEAARELDLSDTRASTTHRDDRPYGCYYRPESRRRRRLWWAPNGNDSSRSRTRFAVCVLE